jgi:hypothetical protein
VGEIRWGVCPQESQPDCPVSCTTLQFGKYERKEWTSQCEGEVLGIAWRNPINDVPINAVASTHCDLMHNLMHFASSIGDVLWRGWL